MSGISGRHSPTWGAAVDPIADEVKDLVSALPTRFREHLALVCESHHLSNLNSIDIYPLCQHYGLNRDETANVQYAAILLRAADLLHITKDRTPSV